MSCLPVALIMGLSENLEKPMVFEAFANMQASWNLLSSSRPHYVTFRKPRKTNGFWSILGYAAFWESLVFVSPSSCDLQKTYKNQRFFKDFGICSPLGISCLRVTLIMWPSENLEKQMVFEAFWDMQPSWNLLFSYGVQSSYKIASRSPQDRSRTPQNAPRPPTWG